MSDLTSKDIDDAAELIRNQGLNKGVIEYSFRLPIGKTIEYFREKYPDFDFEPVEEGHKE